MATIIIEESKFSFVDPGIHPAVEILNSHGFETYESCQGGEGHSSPDPFVSFYGDEHDLIKAFEICHAYGLNAGEAQRVFWKEDVYKKMGENKENDSPIGKAISKPFNRIIFAIHVQTGTIFLPD